MNVRFNLNDPLLVRLTARGEAVIDAFYRPNGFDWRDAFQPRQDGRIKIVVWEMMHIFGPACVMGTDNLFEDNEVEFA